MNNTCLFQASAHFLHFSCHFASNFNLIDTFVSLWIGWPCEKAYTTANCWHKESLHVIDNNAAKCTRIGSVYIFGCDLACLPTFSTASCYYRVTILQTMCLSIRYHACPTADVRCYGTMVLFWNPYCAAADFKIHFNIFLFVLFLC